MCMASNIICSRTLDGICVQYHYKRFFFALLFAASAFRILILLSFLSWMCVEYSLVYSNFTIPVVFKLYLTYRRYDEYASAGMQCVYAALNIELYWVTITILIIA